MEEEIKDLEVSHTPGKGRYRILLLPLSGHIEYSLTTPQTKTILLSLRPLFLLTSCLKWHFLLQWLFLVASPASILHPEISIRVLNFLVRFSLKEQTPSTKHQGWILADSDQPGHYILCPQSLAQEWTCDLSHPRDGNGGLLLGKKLSRSTLSATRHKRSSKGTPCCCQPSDQLALEQRQHLGRPCEEQRIFLSEILSHQIHQPLGLPQLRRLLLESINYSAVYIEYVFCST